MKKFAIILALMLFQTQIMASAATSYTKYNKKPAQKTTATKQVKQTVKQTKPANDSDYLLKYNIDDLEAAPWLNGGKRKI